MKKIGLFVFAVGILFSINGQISNENSIQDLKKKGNCYDKEANQRATRFVNSECGKLAGIVDCNEKLTYDEDSKLIMSGKIGLPFSGTCETCHLNGLLERRITFVDGKENGIDSSYYKSGCLQVVRNHLQGVEFGQWTYYYDSTNLTAWEINYNLGKLHGKQIYLTKSGDTTRFEFYRNGLLHGARKTYFPKSKIEKEINYVNGLMDGAFKSYNMDGKLVQDLSYKQGKKTGELKYYYNDGVLLTIEHWTSDVKDGEFKTFYYKGGIQTMENYKKGVPEGWFEERYQDEKLKRSAFYKKGILIEEHRFNEYGEEIYTIGGQSNTGKEDDAMPVKPKKKKSKNKTSENNSQN